MIILQGDKPYTQFVDLLAKRMKPVKIYQLFKPTLLWDEGLAGVINGHKFWVFLFSPYMAVMPYRYFFAEIIIEDNGIKIIGKFRYHPHIFITFLIIYAIFAWIDFKWSFELFVITSVMLIAFFIIGLVIGVLFGKKRENETIKCLEKMLTEE